MMRIAVAGGGGLGHLLASSIAQAENAYNVIVLSRTQRPEYTNLDIQVHTVNYQHHESLSYALKGVDMVISTISGPAQINLILAAGDGKVKYFVPSEYEGSLRHRPHQGADPWDRGSKQALDLLKHLAGKSRLRYTVFSCGVLMETFLPYGLGSLGIGHAGGGGGVGGVGQPGQYLLDINNAWAEYPETNGRKEPVRVCLTSVYDLARYIVAAIDLGPRNWPSEFTLRGDRLTTKEIVSRCEVARNVPFTKEVRAYADIEYCGKHFETQGDYARVAYYQRLLATADGRYDFSTANLNDIVKGSSRVSVHPMTFSQWLAYVCEPEVS